MDIAADALRLGAHVYTKSKEEGPVARLQRLGGAKAIVTMIGDVQAIAALMGALVPQGRLVLFGAGTTLARIRWPSRRGQAERVGIDDGHALEN